MLTFSILLAVWLGAVIGRDIWKHGEKKRARALRQALREERWRSKADPAPFTYPARPETPPAPEPPPAPKKKARKKRIPIEGYAAQGAAHSHFNMARQQAQFDALNNYAATLTGMSPVHTDYQRHWYEFMQNNPCWNYWR